MKKIFILIISFLSIFYSSQDIRGWNKPTSPEVAMIKKVGDIPVGYYTGTMNVPINLYTIKEGNFSLPITLQYAASGIKVDEQATWVGLGWNLAPEGTITQEVRGVRDEYDVVYKSANPPAGYNALLQRINGTGPTSFYKVVPQVGIAGWIHCSLSTSCAPTGNSPGDDSESAILSLTNGSGQPDIYHFNFAGYSGSFFLNPITKQPVQLDKKDDITFIVQNTNIKAITSEGTTFTFSDLEVINFMGNGANEPRNGQNYKLTEILFPNQKKINFEYQNARYESIYFSQTRNVQVNTSVVGNSSCGGKINYFYQPLFQNNYSSNVKILKSIKTSDLTINFNLEDREDVNLDYAYTGSSTPAIKGTLKKLGSVDIINPLNNKKIKTYKFNYTYFPYADSGTPTGGNAAFITYNKDVFGKRLKLNSLESVTYDENEAEIHTNDVHSFEYNMQNTLPLKIALSKDFWGYYNAKNNGTLIPDLSYFPTPMEVPSNYQGANRHSDKNFVDSYILKKVTYPTKGYSEFEYETNTFVNQFIPSEQNILNFYQNYSFANRGIVGGYPTFPAPVDINVPYATYVKFYTIFSPGFDGSVYGIGARKYDWSQMYQAQPSAKIYKVIMVNGVETTELIKSWEFGAMCDYSSFNAGLSCDKEEYVNLPQGKIRVILSMNNSMYLPADTYHLSGVDLRFTLADYLLADGKSSEGHGVRIKSIKNYSNQGTLAEWKQFEYQGGILHNRYNPFKKKTYGCYDCDALTSCMSSSQMPTNDVYEIRDDMTDTNFDAVGYSSVTEKNIDVNIGVNSVKGKKVYGYYNLENKTASFFPVLKEEMNGLLQNESSFNTASSNLFTKRYYYKNIISENNFPNIDIQNTFLTNGSDPHSSSYGRTKYVYYVTPLVSRSHKLDSVVTAQYFTNNIIKSREYFTYNTRGSVLVHDVKYDDEILKTEYNYAEDLGNAYLGSKNMFGVPLTTTVKKTVNNSTKILSVKEVKYPESTAEAGQKTSGFPIPYSSVSYDLQNNIPTTEVSYNKYDSKGNLQQYTTKDGIPVAIIWGYNNTQPIAKVEGATYAQVQSLVSAISTASDTDALADRNNDETAFLSVLKTFRDSLPDYLVTTYTYDPLIGVRSITPPSGIREVYFYDTANRLVEIKQEFKNANGSLEYKILKEFKYNYKN